jgi:hypothetical protein
MAGGTIGRHAHNKPNAAGRQLIEGAAERQDVVEETVLKPPG